MARERDKTSGRFMARQSRERELSPVGGAAGSHPLLLPVDQQPPRPKQCRTYVRREVARALPVLVGKLLELAAGGSLPHLKVLVQLGGLDTGKPGQGRREHGKSLEAVLQERWREDRLALERERAVAGGGPETMGTVRSGEGV